MKTPGGEYPPLTLAGAPFLPKLAQMSKGKLTLSVELMVMMMVACLVLMASLIFVNGKIDTGDPDEISHYYLQGV